VTLRVGFFGQTGPYAPPALRHLLAHAGSAFDIVLAVEGRRTQIGRRDHLLVRPEGGVINMGDLPLGEDLAQLSLAAGIPILRTCEINAPAAVRHLLAHEIDVIVCVGFDRLFGAEVLASAPRGGLNCHPSKLPEWRGPSPIFWALKEGRRDLAVSVHGLDAREDHGPIYAQESFILPRRGTGEIIYDVAGRLAARLLVPLLERLSTGAPLSGAVQDETRASRAPRPSAEDVLVDPLTWSCEHLVDFACGAPFFRTPWLKLGDEVFFVRQGLLAQPQKSLPAQYYQRDDLLIVQCKDGLAHLEIQV
jgi:methionyl-tRNA formyltransferase